MTCDLSEGVTVEFPNAGVEVKAREADVRAKRRNFVMGNFVLSEAAGQLVSRAVPVGAHGFLKFGGHRARRIYRARGAVQFEQNVHGEDQAELTLQDPRMVLERGTVSKNWQSVTVVDAVDYIFRNRDDPQNVITDYQFVDAEVRNERRIGTFDYPSPFGVIDFFDDIEDMVAGWAIEAGEALAGSEAENFRASSIDIKDMSPLAAMKKILNMFELPWWVDHDGTLLIGMDGAWGNVVGTTAGENAIALKNYGITGTNDSTNVVQVRGPFNKTRSVQDWEYRTASGEDLQVIAEAEIPELSGGTDVLELNKNVSGPAELESIAASYLMDKVMDDVEGSLVINAIASSEKEMLAELDIGDVLYVDDSIEQACTGDVITGLFLVNSVQHRVSMRQGWEITLRVSRFPKPSAIRTKSVLYDPLSDKNYEDFDAYQNKRAVGEEEESENIVYDVVSSIYL